MAGSWTAEVIAGKPADVFTPAGNAPPRFGVLFLHAVGLETLVDRPAFTNLLAESRLACVCPHGQHSWWTDRICREFDTTQTAERYVLDAVVPYFKTRWNLAPPAIGLLGISMGGQGALRLAFRHAQTFPVVAGIASALDYHEFYYQAPTLQEMYESKEQCRQDTALMHLPPYNPPPYIYFCVDPEDTAWFRGNDRLHEKMNALGVAAHRGPGHHGRWTLVGIFQPHGGTRAAFCPGGVGQGKQAARLKVSLMITCLGDALFPDVGVATVRLLRRLGLQVEFPQAQTCCGQPQYNSGYHDDARALARHTIRAFAGSNLVVTPSGSCAAMVKLEYPELFHNDMVWHGRAEDLARRTHELSDFLVNVLGVDDVGAHFAGTATYHMACHLRGLGLTTEPLRLLGKVRGLTLVPLERFDECCGFGGSFAVRYPGISGAMVTDKASYIEKTGADLVVTTDAGCLMNIGGCIRRRGCAVQFRHLAEILVNTGPGEDPHMTDYAKHEHHDFTAAAAQALGNASLQAALTRLADTLMAGNRRGFAALKDSDALRDHAKQIKEHTLAHLDHYLEQLEASVRKLGGTVHWAATAEDARQIVVQIARNTKCRRAVKSKSMTSEEIHLNPALAKAGIEVTETDFGEYILQVAGERPSHLVAPAVHHTRESVARILSEHLGETLSDDPQSLAQTGRRVLRQKFHEADLGITGVNFAVAETGTVVLVTNEGNGRLTTTCPRVHVAIMGMEKVIPRFADLPVFLKLLARGATGQTLSVYTTILSGKRRRRTGWSGRVPPGNPRQWALEGFGLAISRKLAMYPLRRLPQCLSGLSPHWRPRLWGCLCRPDWQHPDTALRQR